MIFGFVLFLFAVFKAYEYKERTRPSIPKVEVMGVMVPVTKIVEKQHGRIGFNGGFCSRDYRRPFKYYLKNYAPCLIISIVMGVVIGQIWASSVLPFIGFGVARTWGAGSSMDGNWNTATCWTGDAVPGAGDAVTFDSTDVTNCAVNVDTAALASLTIAATYSGTITVGINQTGTKGTFSIAAGTYNTNGFTDVVGAITVTGGTLTLGASTVTWTSFTATSGTSTINLNTAAISMSGAWNSAGALCTMNASTSTITFTVSTTIRTRWSLTDNSNFLYNIVVNAGVTLTNGSGTAFKGVLSGSGTFAFSATLTLISPTTANPITISNLTGNALADVYFCVFSTDFNAPGTTCNTYQCLGGGGYTLTLTSAVTAASYISVYAYGVAGTTRLNLNGQTISMAGSTSMYVGDTGKTGILMCGSSTISMSGTVLITTAASYIVFNTSTWSVGGNWTCPSTSASWNCGTSTINFNGTTAQTLGLNNGNSANITYYNITISNSGVVNVTMGANTATVSGAWNCSTTTATILWNTNNGNLTVAGGFTLANGCGWTKGTGTLTFNGTQNVADNNAVKKDLGTVTTSGAVTVTQTTSLLITTLTIVNTSTWTTTDLIAYGVYNPGGTWNKALLPVGTTTITTLNLNVGGTLNSRENPPPRCSEPFEMDMPIRAACF